MLNFLASWDSIISSCIDSVVPNLVLNLIESKSNRFLVSPSTSKVMLDGFRSLGLLLTLDTETFPYCLY